MNLYIKGTGILSPLSESDQPFKEATVHSQTTDRLLCREPDYTGIIAPMQLRRMSKVVRMGIGAAKRCLKDAGQDHMNAISVGTAFGCLDDTERFLSKMVKQEEKMLTPTAFIQSTHNTVAGQIALTMGCHGHNLTFVQRGNSFELAFLDAHLYLANHPEECILVGGIEELTETSLKILQEFGIYRKEKTSPSELLHNTEKGSIPGEGAAFFLVGQVPPDYSCLQIRQLSAFTAATQEEALDNLTAFLGKHHWSNPDLVMLGINGSERTTHFYDVLRYQIFADTPQAAFKHLCGEYPVASSFALALLSASVQGQVPVATILNRAPQKLESIVMINSFLNYYSCWLLEVYRPN